MIEQRGSFVLGLVVGLLVGLSLALGVALYITKAPIPFVNKVPPRTAEQDKVEAERNKNWDPNAPLGARGSARPGTPAASAPVVSAGASAVVPASAGTATAASAAPPKSSRDPAALLAGGAASGVARSTAPGIDPFVYFVQVGAYANADEAEQQRGKLALAGLAAKVTEREQSGRTMYRVRLGPYERKDDADAVQARLAESSIEARLVRVERN